MSQEKGLDRNIESHQNGSNRHDHNKFPVREVIILVLCVSVNAYTLVNLFPYVGIMVMQLMELKSINEAGFYAGYVASAFTFGRFLSGYAIGYMSDVVGRKPVLILGLLSITIFSLLFGFSESFSWAICSRFILGLTNGIMAASRTLIREACGREHVVMGMVYIGGARAVALVLGTGIGGLLALPAVHYPTVFSSTGLFARYPFLLPNIFGATFAGLTLHIVIFWLPESKRLTNNQGAGEFRRLSPEETAEEGNSRVTDGGTFGVNAAETATLNGNAEEAKMGFWGRGGIIRNRIVLAILFLGCIVQAVVVGFDEAFPLWMLSTPDVGGLGWDSKQIGEVLLTTGLLMGVIQFTVLPSAMKAIGIVRWYRAGWVLLVLTLVLAPNAKNISWNSSSLFVVATISSLLVNCCLSAITIAASVASTNIVPVQHRGKLSGLYNTAESLGRFTGPVTYSTTFALSISTSGPGSGLPWMDHHFVFYVTAIVLALLATIGWRTLTSEVLNRSATG